MMEWQRVLNKVLKNIKWSIVVERVKVDIGHTHLV